MKTEMVQAIKDFLINKLDPVFIIVFGSYAKGYNHEHSDIDIAFYCEKSSQTKYEVFMLAQNLADILKNEIDLVDISSASTVFKAQIYTTGNVIYSKDDYTLKNLQMTALSMYAKLNEEREDVLKSIKESGSVYE
ncbi:MULTISPECIES: nucleotidyltransferase domain-containing protein [unclassified Bacillus (in: firmicutes)]|uniref:type VII toxin-antitoxin system MntA family adenylyltransferase antitoxin n=1 Tax=unclassified Bacillus (in: firmicutes) TaxID=185979 RepID=UPI0008F0450B|nr:MULTISPECIES: nucleotidyltransferase domain-containing protein [unclassified Bacillus (in: firmicutes)]SFB03869.1 Predicted nucleotidyltransferase [Bacillus sp. UNCCL13]SFQ88664.1 Predicted nucleotidyltransferase [Bacillus sp. cl95]